MRKWLFWENISSFEKEKLFSGNLYIFEWNFHSPKIVLFFWDQTNTIKYFPNIYEFPVFVWFLENIFCEAKQRPESLKNIFSKTNETLIGFLSQQSTPKSCFLSHAKHTTWLFYYKSYNNQGKPQYRSCNLWSYEIKILYDCLGMDIKIFGSVWLAWIIKISKIERI